MAVMVHDGLFVGSDADTYKFAGSVLHCARDPWFATAEQRCLHPKRFEDYGIVLGGTGTTYEEFLATPKTWVRFKYNEMALNMVDADDPRYFSDEMINAGLEFITDRMADGDPVLVHCNMGMSRSPSMAFLWMFEHGLLDYEFRYALPQFKRLYPDYAPGNGIWQYLKNRCDTSKKYECQGIGRGASCGATATETVKTFGHLGGDNWGDKEVHLCPDCKKELDRRKHDITLGK